MGVGYKLSDQANIGYDIFLMVEEATCLQAILLAGFFNLIVIFWKINTTGHKKSNWSHGFSDHEMAEFKIVRGGSKANSRITTIDLKKPVWPVERFTWNNPMGYVPE